MGGIPVLQAEAESGFQTTSQCRGLGGNLLHLTEGAQCLQAPSVCYLQALQERCRSGSTQASARLGALWEAAEVVRGNLGGMDNDKGVLRQKVGGNIGVGVGKKT